MTLNRTALMLIALLMVSTVAVADDADADSARTLSVRTFQFKHKDADRAAAMIKQLMSAEGSLSIQPGTNSLSITDRAENLKAIAAALAKYDTPPQAFKLTVRLVSAERVDPANAPAVSEALKDVADKLSMRQPWPGFSKSRPTESITESARRSRVAFEALGARCPSGKYSGCCT